jgi:hypothetical protein
MRQVLEQTAFSFQEGEEFLRDLGIDVSELKLPSSDLSFTELTVSYEPTHQAKRITGGYIPQYGETGEVEQINILMDLD